MNSVQFSDPVFSFQGMDKAKERKKTIKQANKTLKLLVPDGLMVRVCDSKVDGCSSTRHGNFQSDTVVMMLYQLSSAHELFMNTHTVIVDHYRRCCCY